MIGLPSLPCKRSATDNLPNRINFPLSCVTSNCTILNGIIQFLSLIINTGIITSYFLSTMIIFPFFSEFHVFSIENFKIISNFGPLQRMSCITKHVSKAAKVETDDRLTLPLKIACKPDPLARVTLAQGNPLSL